MHLLKNKKNDKQNVSLNGEYKLYIVQTNRFTDWFKNVSICCSHFLYGVIYFKTYENKF